MSPGSTSTAATTADENHAMPGTIQPPTSSANSAIGTRLRRRLSRIFHCDSQEMGLGTRRPAPAGT